jgi:lipopolysaccharide/colanic/teichoic acid biosynthesis glycosyltransferase
MPSSTSQNTTAADPIKRLFDIVTSAAGLVLLSPLFVLIALWIKLDSSGPVFYRAQRVGRDGHLFALYKFRSMVVHADRQGPGITAAGDRRVTRAGHFLRRTKLDELPQLINVLVGDMSLVGPRPEDQRYVALYTPEQRRVLAVRPGMTSAASLAYRHEEQFLFGPDWEDVYRDQIMPAKLAIDLAYIEQRSFWGDLRLIISTMRSMTE